MTRPYAVEYVDLSKDPYDQEMGVMATSPTQAAQYVVNAVKDLDCGQTITVTNVRTNEISFFILNDAFELQAEQD